MEAGNILTFGIGPGTFCDDLVERQGRGVDDPRAGWTVGQQGRWDQRSGIEADRTGCDQVPAAECDQVWRARSGADEMDGHGRDAPWVTATAQVAPWLAMRGRISSAPEPAPASAAASATEGTPNRLLAWTDSVLT